MNRNEFLEDYNDFWMQAVEFTYKGKRYSVCGFWAIYAQDDNGDSHMIDDNSLRTKEAALNYKAFDGGTKALIDIIEEISDVDFSF